MLPGERRALDLMDDLRLRNEFGRGTRLLIKKVIVLGYFREFKVDLAGAANFGYVLGDCLYVDLRMHFV